VGVVGEKGPRRQVRFRFDQRHNHIICITTHMLPRVLGTGQSRVPSSSAVIAGRLSKFLFGFGQVVDT
jgi:hypothetical protein